MGFAAFVLSTGRCGTQWLARMLDHLYGDRIAVTHEPLQDRYYPRTALVRRQDPDGRSNLLLNVAEHLIQIERQLESTSYVECGHPCWSTVPDLLARFQGRIRIIHLVRHPVPTSCSWLTHGAYQPPAAPHLRPKVLLAPFDAGVRFPEYQRNWPELSPFEKCVYYWLEVNTLALHLQSQKDLPWLQVRYEDLFAGDGLARVLDFLELPPCEDAFGQRDLHVDQFQSITSTWPDWRKIHEHPQAVMLANRYGYSLDDLDESALKRRYLPPAVGEEAASAGDSNPPPAGEFNPG